MTRWPGRPVRSGSGATHDGGGAGGRVQHAELAGRRVAAGLLLGMLRATPAECYAACGEAVGAFDVRDRLGKITAPMLVVAAPRARRPPST